MRDVAQSTLFRQLGCYLARPWDVPTRNQAPSRTSKFELLFLVAIAVMAYLYAGHPVVLALLAQTFGHEVYRDSATPTVTTALAARQEASVIQQKLENFEMLQSLLSVPSSTIHSSTSSFNSSRTLANASSNK